MISLDDALSARTEVVDGLWLLSPGDTSSPKAASHVARLSGADRSEAPLADMAISKMHQVDMLGAAEVRSLSMPDAQQATIRQGRMIPAPNTRTPAIGFGRTAVRSPESFREHPVEVKDGRRMLLASPAVHASEQISRFPQRRKSMDLGRLNDSERRSFLHEAEVLKHLPADRAELLAVFRSIPIELISRLRFLAGRKEILYSISRGPTRTRTNVHDMAAIRDSANQEVHLVPHRTKSRPVRLAGHSNGEGI